MSKKLLLLVGLLIGILIGTALVIASAGDPPDAFVVPQKIERVA